MALLRPRVGKVDVDAGERAGAIICATTSTASCADDANVGRAALHRAGAAARRRRAGASRRRGSRRAACAAAIAAVVSPMPNPISSTTGASRPKIARQSSGARRSDAVARQQLSHARCCAGDMPALAQHEAADRTRRPAAPASVAGGRSRDARRGRSDASGASTTARPGPSLDPRARSFASIALAVYSTRSVSASFHATPASLQRPARLPRQLLAYARASTRQTATSLSHSCAQKSAVAKRWRSGDEHRLGRKAEFAAAAALHAARTRAVAVRREQHDGVDRSSM